MTQKALKSVNILDLTVQQVADIEDGIGLPVNKWQEEAPSMGRLYAKILAVGNGVGDKTFLDMTMGDLIGLVNFDEKDTDPND